MNGRRLAGVGDDCCDRAGGGGIFPGNTNLTITPQGVCSTVGSFDYDCSGLFEDQFDDDTSRGGCGANCQNSVWVGPVPGCGEFGEVQDCGALVGGSCTMGAISETIRACR
jgi:hypothetical protein